jgi:hypothetical protein
MYGINWNTFIQERVPSPARKPVMVGWLNAMLSPLKTLHTLFLVFRNTEERNLEITPQVRILRYWLNEFFDFDDRRFEILDYENVEPILIWGESYNSPVYLPVFMSSSAFDFIVIAPCEAQVSVVQIRAFLDRFKLAGKRYKLSFQDGSGNSCILTQDTLALDG